MDPPLLKEESLPLRILHQITTRIAFFFCLVSIVYSGMRWAHNIFVLVRRYDLRSTGGMTRRTMWGFVLFVD